jgi:hypothetical protein
MDEKQRRLRQRILEKIQEFTLMDDDFMTVAFDNDIPCTQYVLRIIMQNDTLVVKSVKTQYEIKSLQGRSVRLDVRAEDSSVKIYDIEIQNADSGAGARRARYNSALMDADATVPNMDTESLPETYVIFITANDVLGGSLPLYHIDRFVKEQSFKPFNDGAHIIYVNGSHRGEDPIGSLMQDFSCKKASDMKSGVLSEKVRQLKESDKGVGHMCKIMQDFVREEREVAKAEGRLEGRAEGKSEIAEKMLRQNRMTLEEIAEMTELPMETVKRLAEQVSARQ